MKKLLYCLPLAVLLLGLTATAWAEQSDTQENPADTAKVAKEMPGDDGPVDSSDCSKCHNNAEKKTAKIKYGIIHEFYVDLKKFAKSVHGNSDNEMGCTDCHDSGFEEFPHSDMSIQHCVDCHEDTFTEIKKEVEKSVHYQLDSVTFGCTVCHQAHYMRPAKDMTLTEKNEMCVGCHNHQLLTRGMTLKELHSWHPLAPLHLDNTACIACHTQPIDGVSEAAFKHKILKASEASRKCEDCHSPDGKMLHYLIDIGHEAKTGMSQEEMLKHFYITGSSNVEWIDWAGLLMLAAIFAGILGHSFLRIIFRKKGTEQ